MIVALLLACSEPVEPESFEISDGEDGVELSEQDSGWFALKHVVSTLVANPLNQDERAPSLTTSYLLAEYTRDGTSVRWIETLCDISSTEVFGTLSSFPDAFVDTMPPRERTVTLSELATGATLDGGPFVDVNGAQLDDPDNDPLPEDPEASTVYDQDRDGEPGMTILITHDLLGTGEIYAAQREWKSVTGELVSADRLEGYVDAEGEQTVLGASEAWLTLSTPAPIPDPEPTHSYFILQRIDGDDCGTVLAERAELFDEDTDTEN